MKRLLRLLPALLLLAAPSLSHAYDFTVDGIYYNITSTTDLIVEVTYKSTSYNSYSGDITIPENATYNGTTYAITSIGSNAFCKCTSLTSITIPDAVTSIGNSTFYQCTSLTSASIGDAVESIGDFAFCNCTSLTSVSISDAVESIGNSAFKTCTLLTSVSIGNAVDSIGDYAFYGCYKLTDVYSRNTTPPACSSSDCFSSSIYNSATLHVPSESVSDYVSATAWKNFATIEGIIESDTVVDSEEADSTSIALRLHFNDGSVVTYLLSRRPRVTFSDGNIIITTNSIEATYPTSDIAKLTYRYQEDSEEEDEESGIDNILVDETSFNIKGGVIMLSGFTEGSTARVYTIGGLMVQSVQMESGSCSIPLSSLPSGVYVISVNGKSFKIAKK